MSSSSLQQEAPPKFCFNPECQDSKSDRWTKGWRLRNLNFARLCYRCGSIYEAGKFCETFHIHASGWRCCETCGKRVHCGCIVSMHAFVVLDAGGIECTVCTRKNSNLTPNPIWPPQSLPRWPTACVSVKDCNQIGRSDSPATWHQPMSLFNKNPAYPDSQSRSYFEHDKSIRYERLVYCDRLAGFASERNQTRNLSFCNGSLQHNGSSERLEYGKSVFSQKEEMCSCLTISGHQSLQKDGQSVMHLGKAFSSSPVSQAENQRQGCGVHFQQRRPQDVIGKKLSSNSHSGTDFSRQTQIWNCKPVDVHSQKELLPRSWPKIPDNELQQISGGYKSVITPLFEKMLSVSDAGRVGRLVLPKKCAESYFPRITHPEGLPLEVQDIKGKEWLFQFRFWPNNNSRMYVLEGITSCIQSLQLQAGDIVTFSRIEPEGKLMMGFRKASSGSQSVQGFPAVKNSIDTVGDVATRKPKLYEDLTNCHMKGDVVKEANGASSSISSRKKNGMLSSKRKRSKVNNVDLLEPITLEEVQELLRSPADHALHVEIIEDYEFEEYEDAPVIGRPTIIVKDSVGDYVQWAQCDDCLNWRKLPSDFVLPARWTCSKNLWDRDRCSCDAAQELTMEQIKNKSTYKPGKSLDVRREDGELDAPICETFEAFARFSIQGDGDACLGPAQLTTKHPRHKPGCSCVVCVQPPSGKSPRHEPSCTCNVCIMIKRRFRTMMLRRERSQSGKESATGERNSKYLKASQKSEPTAELLKRSSTKCVNTSKGKIDLNIQPERDEEASTGCDCTETTTIMEGAAKRRLCDSDCRINLENSWSNSQAGRSSCEKQKVALNHRNSNNSSTVGHPPVLQFTSTSVSR